MSVNNTMGIKLQSKNIGIVDITDSIEDIVNRITVEGLGQAISQDREFCLVLGKDELSPDLTVEDLVLKYGLEDGDTFVLWARIMAGGKRMIDLGGGHYRTAYSTLQLIHDLVDEMSELVPKDVLNKVTRKLTLSDASTFLGRNKGYLSNIINKITKSTHRNYNPKFLFSEENLDYFKESLDEVFKGKALKCYEIIKNYKMLNTLKTHHKQIEGLKKGFFKEIISREQSYWFGFLIDGYFDRRRGRIEIEIAAIDKRHLKTFCEVIGINPKNYIKYRDRFDKRTGNTYKMVRVVVSDKYMFQDILGHDFKFGSKTKGKDLPDFIKEIDDPCDNPIALAWLYGVYDAEGKEGESCIYSADKYFLDKIREKFNIQNPVLESDTDYWYLFVGARLINKMMASYEKGLSRKLKDFDISKEKIDVLKELLMSKNIGREELQELTKYFTKNELIVIFDTSYKVITKLIEEWNIQLPPTGYWSTRAGLSIKENRAKLFEHSSFLGFLKLI